MKLSFSIMLLVAAAAQINAAVTPKVAATCIAGSSGLGKGDGYKGYCCKDQADCLDDCVKGVCVGPIPPSKTTTTVPTSTPTAGTCVAGSAGLGKGDGYKGYCCKNQADCVDDCVKGVCVGPAPPTKTSTKTTSTSTKTTTTVPTSTPTSGTCVAGSAGLGRGDGYKGYCCKDQADCMDDCVKGVCVGPTAPTTLPTPGACTPGSSGNGKGDGKTNACCKSSADCQDTCTDGRCGISP